MTAQSRTLPGFLEAMLRQSLFPVLGLRSRPTLYPSRMAGTLHRGFSLTTRVQPDLGNERQSSAPTRSLILPALCWVDYAGMLAGVALIFAVALINGHGRMFWEDETLGWVLLRDPSWSHMLQAWRLGADGGGIFFYILGRTWFHLFGEGITSFRLFSATGFGMALLLLWISLRRFYSPRIVAFAVFNTFFFSPPLTFHYMEGRFYGLLVFGTALALFLALALDALPDPLPKRWYACAFGVHLLLTGSHVLGVVYSFFLLCAVLLLDHLRGRSRPWLYLAIGSSWLLLLWERTALIATAQVGKPHFWTRAPNLGQVLGGWSVFSPEIFLVLLLLLLTALAVLPRNPQQQRAAIRQNIHARLALYVVAGCVLAVPAGFLAEGLVGTWLFTDRYLQPVALGVACLTAELSWCALRGFQANNETPRWWVIRSVAKGSFSLIFAAALVYWVFGHQANYTPSVPDFTRQLTDHVPQGLPVVVEDAFTFTDLMSRPAGGERPYTFLLNWGYALSAEAQLAEVTQYHLMQNWQRAGYFSKRIEDETTFLKTHDRFVVISNSILGGDSADRPETGNPVAARLRSGEGYDVRPLFVLDRRYRDSQRDTVWLVSRRKEGVCVDPCTNHIN